MKKEELIEDISECVAKRYSWTKLALVFCSLRDEGKLNMWVVAEQGLRNLPQPRLQTPYIPGWMETAHLAALACKQKVWDSFGCHSWDCGAISAALMAEQHMHVRIIHCIHSKCGWASVVVHTALKIPGGNYSWIR